MKIQLLVILFCMCISQLIFSQEENGVVSYNLPIRNSLTFNRFVVNPTFSFVREQHKYISVYNRREWVQFDNAPITYLASYSGRFAENIGAGLGVFQQNYGVLTTFGGTLNFAYNVNLDRDSNLTFGVNIGAYKSGLNSGNVVTNFDDPALQNIPDNFLLTINPGINYGLAFIDLGFSINNLALYNLETSSIIEDDSEQSIQAHMLYTGYMDSRGFFDESKFTGLITSDFTQDKTIIAAMAMLTVPKGIWAQVGYNTLYGISGGIGLNITSQIAMEYNYEKAIGDLANFGSSHTITLGYRFKNNNYYDYSNADEVTGLFESNKPILARSSKTKSNPELRAKRKAEIEAQRLAKLEAKQENETQAKLVAEQKVKEEAEAQAKLVAEQKAKEEAEAQAKLVADQKAKEETEAQAKLAVEQKAKEEAEAQAKLVAEQKAKEEAEAQAKLIAEQKAKEEAEAQAKLIAEQKAKEETNERAKEEIAPESNTQAPKALNELTNETEAIGELQNQLIQQYKDIIDIKDQDLKDLKEENDLSEQGITVEPKPFKSISEENRRLLAIKANLDAAIEERSKKISELKKLYDDSVDEVDTIVLDEVYVYYRNKINKLENEQLAALKVRAQLEKRLEQINVATTFERNRRIKRAAFDNEQDRYSQDRATLENIKNTTEVLNEPLTVNEFDFGEERTGNIQIIKNINTIESGYYLLLAVHSDIKSRDEFVKKVVASGGKDVDFFYDASTSKYYIYYSKYSTIQSANQGLESNKDEPYKQKMSLIKIEN